ncbi:MAG: hypothetical protein IPM29_19055 [Planctomycetes bacterium]|nr:hypothetical protein [Planctomycetota bacterium]
MAARILSTIAFWILMTMLIAGGVVVVCCLYLPFVALKAAYLAVTGRIDEARGGRRRAADATTDGATDDSATTDRATTDGSGQRANA